MSPEPIPRLTVPAALPDLLVGYVGRVCRGGQNGVLIGAPSNGYKGLIYWGFDGRLHREPLRDPKAPPLELSLGHQAVCDHVVRWAHGLDTRWSVRKDKDLSGEKDSFLIMCGNAWVREVDDQATADRLLPQTRAKYWRGLSESPNALEVEVAQLVLARADTAWRAHHAWAKQALSYYIELNESDA